MLEATSYRIFQTQSYTSLQSAASKFTPALTCHLLAWRWRYGIFRARIVRLLPLTLLICMLPFPVALSHRFLHMWLELMLVFRSECFAGETPRFTETNFRDVWSKQAFRPLFLFIKAAEKENSCINNNAGSTCRCVLPAVRIVKNNSQSHFMLYLYFAIG